MSYLNPKKLISEYLTNASSPDLNVDGSVTPVEFSYRPNKGETVNIARLLIYLEGGTNFAAEDFANLATALTNGLTISFDGAQVASWRDNVDIVTTMYDVEGYASLNNIARSISGRWTLNRAAPGFAGVEVTYENGGVVATVNDNLSTLTQFRIRAQGHVV